MRRRRTVPADPVRTTAETIAAIADLIDGALPGIERAEVEAALTAGRAYLGYLIRREYSAAEPLTLVSDSFACDIYTAHGEAAQTASEPGVPPGAAGNTSWELFLPVPDGCGFTDDEVEQAHERLRAGSAPADAGVTTQTAASALSDLVDAESLREIGGSL